MSNESQRVEKDCVVRFHYTMTDTDGAVVDTSRDGEPTGALIGHGNVLAAIESALLGRGPGEHLRIALTPEQAFGAREEGRTQRVPKKHFQRPARLKPGMRTSLQTDHGMRQVTVLKIGSSVIDVDTNHPLAGKHLDVDLEIVDIRPATVEEIAHRHAHGDGGHAH